MPPLRQCLSSGPNFTLRNYQLFQPNSQILAVDRPWSPTGAVQSILHSSARSIIKPRQTFTARLQLSSLTDKVHHFTEVTDNLRPLWALAALLSCFFSGWERKADDRKHECVSLCTSHCLNVTVLSHKDQIQWKRFFSVPSKHRYYIIYSLQKVNIVHIFQEQIYYIQTASSLPTKVQKSTLV